MDSFDRTRYPALALWWDELDAGLRTKQTLDVLWGIACEEFHALEYERMNIATLAESHLEEARRLAAKARKELIPGAA